MKNLICIRLESKNLSGRHFLSLLVLLLYCIAGCSAFQVREVPLKVRIRGNISGVRDCWPGFKKKIKCDELFEFADIPVVVRYRIIRGGPIRTIETETDGDGVFIIEWSETFSINKRYWAYPGGGVTIEGEYLTEPKDIFLTINPDQRVKFFKQRQIIFKDGILTKKGKRAYTLSFENIVDPLSPGESFSLNRLLLEMDLTPLGFDYVKYNYYLKKGDKVKAVSLARRMIDYLTQSNLIGQDEGDMGWLLADLNDFVLLYEQEEKRRMLERKDRLKRLVNEARDFYNNGEYLKVLKIYEKIFDDYDPDEHRPYVTEIKNKKAKALDYLLKNSLFVIKSRVNIRSGAGKAHRIIFVARYGDRLLYMNQEEGDWYRVELENGRVGWVHNSLVSGQDPIRMRSLIGDLKGCLDDEFCGKVLKRVLKGEGFISRERKEGYAEEGTRTPTD